MGMLSALARGFEIQLDSVVKHVELHREGTGASSSSSVKLTDTRNNEYAADRVRTTPLHQCNAWWGMLCVCVAHR